MAAMKAADFTVTLRAPPYVDAVYFAHHGV
jgi:hypothetical protein